MWQTHCALNTIGCDGKRRSEGCGGGRWVRWVTLPPFSRRRRQLPPVGDAFAPIKAVPFRGKRHGVSRDERGLTFLKRKVSKRILIRFEIPGIRQYGRPVSFCGRKKRSFALIQLCAGFCPPSVICLGQMTASPVGGRLWMVRRLAVLP